MPAIGASGDDVMAALQEGHADGDVWRNSKLLLNVPPSRDGRFHETDVARLRGLREALTRMRAKPIVSGNNNGTAVGTAVGTGGDSHQSVRRIAVSPGSVVTVLELAERIEAGQQVTSWQVRADRANGPVLASGSTIGFMQLRRIPSTTVSQLFVEAVGLDGPPTVAVRAYGS